MAKVDSTVLAIDAEGVPVEELAEIVSWRLSNVRKRVLKKAEDVETIYVLRPALARPGKELQDALQDYEKTPHCNRQKLHEIVSDSVKRTVAVYCGFWSIDKVQFVEHIGEIKTKHKKFDTLDDRKEMKIIMDNKSKIDAEITVPEWRRRELSQTLNDVVAPEFDKLNLGIAKIDDNTKAIEADTKEIKVQHGDYLRLIAEKLGIPKP